ncbi:hypothetical protein [Legionella sp. km772]|uniref:hypothetical protein n=1 Tax=Legionella sp. km772 TaxID=2498111 RepID=UPI000F8D4016|nr:hypothetical protein [Legionella sp. km772]RUR09062.1 hypothetical protein ELY15_09690 [Legionella sp. km772]
MFHIFTDANQRTISFLLLNQELKRQGLVLCLLPSPFCFDGHLSADALVIEIQAGQELAKIHLYPAGNVPVLLRAYVDCLNSPESTLHQRLVSLRVLRALASQPSFNNYWYPLKLIERLMQALDGAEYPIKDKIIELLNYLLTECELNHAEKGIELYISALANSSSVAMQQQAAIILSMFSLEWKNRDSKLNSDAIDSLLIVLANHTSLSIQGYAAQTLGQISCFRPEHNKEIGEKGGIELLIKVLTHYTLPWAHQRVLFALVYLSENCLENQKRVEKNVGLDVIIKILVNSLCIGVQEYASKLIKILSCGCPENKQRILEQGGINALINVLATPVSPKVQETVVRAVKTLAENYADNQKEIREKGGMDVLNKVFASSSDAGVKNEITELLRILSPNATEVKNPIAALGFFSGDVGQGREDDRECKYEIKTKPFS